MPAYYYKEDRPCRHSARPAHFNARIYNNDVEMEDVEQRRHRKRVGFDPASIPRNNPPKATS